MRQDDSLTLVAVECPPEATDADPSCGTRHYRVYELRVGEESWKELPNPGELVPQDHPNPDALGAVRGEALYRFGTTVLALRGETWRLVLDLREPSPHTCLSGTKIVQATTGLTSTTVDISDLQSVGDERVTLSTPASSGGPTRVACGSDGALLAPSARAPGEPPLQYLDVDSGRLKAVPGSDQLAGANIVTGAAGRFFAWNSFTSSGIMSTPTGRSTDVPGPNEIGTAVVAAEDAYLKIFDGGYYVFHPGSKPFAPFPRA